jgi:hypothetical protein
LDGLLISHVSKNICDKVNTMKNLSQVAQVVINVEHFVVAVDELESVLVDLKYVKSVIGGTGICLTLTPGTCNRSGNPSSHSHTHSQTLITLQSGASLQSTLEFAQSRIDKIIADKLDQFFEMGWEEFDWTPKLSETVMKARQQAAATSSATAQPAAPASSGGFMSGAFAGAMGFGGNHGNSRPASPGPGLRPQSVLGTPGLKRQSTMIRFKYFDANAKREPSTYLFEMITFLTAYVDSVLIGLREDVRGRAYRGALEHVRDGLLVRIVAP